jgi:hypothetical protein
VAQASACAGFSAVLTSRWTTSEEGISGRVWRPGGSVFGPPDLVVVTHDRRCWDSAVASSTRMLVTALGPLAHPVEQGTFNPKVQGSRPWRPTDISPVQRLSYRSHT